MTITATDSEISYAGNGVTTAFSIPFAFDTSSDLKVTSTDSSGNVSELTTGFVISGGGGSTGTCTFTTAPASGVTITLLDDPDITQPTDYTANDAFPAESHEAALDRQTRISKRLYQLIKRCLRTADGDPISGDSMVLGTVDNRKGKYLFFNAITGAIEYAVSLTTTPLSQSIIGQLLNPQTSGESSASVSPTNYAYPSRPIIDLGRYGVTADGVTDDTTRIQNAINSAPTGATIDGMGLSYAVTQLNVNKRVTLRNIRLVMLNAAILTSQQAGFYVTANDVVIDNCGCTITPAGLTNVTNASGIYSLSTTGLRVRGGVWNGSKQNAGDYTLNIFGSVIHAHLCDDAQVTAARVSNSSAEAIYLWTCTNSKVSECNVSTAGYSGISVDLGFRNKVLDNVIDMTTASGLSFNSADGTVRSNTVRNCQTNGINLAHVPGYSADNTICSENTIETYGINTTGNFGGINVQGGNGVKVIANLIKASANNTASLKYNHGIQIGNNPTRIEVINNTVQTAYGYGIRSIDSADASFITIRGNTVSNSWYDGIAIVGCSRADIKENIVTQSNRANDANSWGISVTRTSTDPLSVDIDENVIVDTTPYQRHGIMVYSLGGTTLALNIRGNTIRGAVTSPINTSGGWVYNIRGNDLVGTARSGSVTLSAGATTTTVTTGQCTLKDQPIIIPGNSDARALSIWFGAASNGSFTIGSAAAVGTEVVYWILP